MRLHLCRRAPLFVAGSILLGGTGIVSGQTSPGGRRGPGGPPPELPEAKAIAQPKNEEELAAAIKKLAGDLAAAGKFSGSILFAAGEKVMVDQAWGEADRKAKVANTPETAFDVGSIPEGHFTRIILCNGGPPMDMIMGATIRGWVQKLPK